jgi:hypothetical protein
MITFEQASILAVAKRYPNQTKKNIGEFLEQWFDCQYNVAMLSALVDGLATANYLVPDKGLPASYTITNSGQAALERFDQNVAHYRDLQRH